MKNISPTIFSSEIVVLTEKTYLCANKTSNTTKEKQRTMVTWLTTPEQAEYVREVNVKRDGIQVGTVDYSTGYFIDNIGSGAASRTYTVVAVDTDGTECPIVSYPKETIHMAYLTGINNTIEVNWNIPTGYDLLGYNICEWHEDDG